MRIRIIHRPTTPSIDGIRLDGFVPDTFYDVGTSLGSLLLAEGWAVPAEAEDPSVPPARQTDGKKLPPNLIIETRASLENAAEAADRPARWSSSRRRKPHD